MKIGEIYYIFCMDCGNHTGQKYKGIYADESRMYICQECGCENYEHKHEYELIESED